MTGEGWSWVSSNPAPYSGALAHQSALLSGVHQHYFYNATTTLSVAVGDTLFAYVYLDPANPPREVMLQWNDGSWEHRAYWGANLIGWGTDGTVSRRYMGPLPAAGQWVRLAVPASAVGLEGRTLNGMAYTLYDGRATWDYAGKAAATAPTYQLSGTVTLGGAALSGVNFAATSGASCTATDGAGHYACTVPQGWSGTVTPSLSGYTFTPSSRSYSSVAANQTAQNYSAAIDSATTVWVDDAVPAGATLAGTGEGWSWVSSNPAPYSGALAHQSALLSGLHQHYFYNATTTLSVAVGDTLFAYVYLDPANPPREVMLQWNDGSWEHRAYWGANLIGWGTDGTVSRRYMGPLPAAGQWVRLAVPASPVGLEGRTLNGMAYTLYDGRATWDYAGKVSATTVWADDAVPAGATVGGMGEGWSWVSSNPAPYSGALAHQSALLSGMHQHYFYNATTTLSVAVGDTLFAYVYLDPANPPREVMLQWNDGSWEHRAYWGANLIGWGTDGTVSRRYMGPLPAAGQWVRLAVPASAVGLEGRTVNGMAYTLYDGRATWDYAGKVSATTVWADDAVPAGATLAGTGEGWSWVSGNPAPYAGALAHQSALLSGVHQHYFYNATTTLSVAVGDTLFAYVYLDPANPPREVMLQWNDGSWEHRAYWGANLIGWGTDGTVSRRYMGPLPAAGQWVRLAVPASRWGWRDARQRHGVHPL